MTIDFTKPLETYRGEPVKHICSDVIEYKNARVCVDAETGLVYSSPYIDLKVRNVMPEWNGEGLPPVGSVIESTYVVEDNAIWHEGTCIASGLTPEGVECCVVKSGSTLAFYRTGSLMRPIRTAEQRLADERAQAIEDMWTTYWQPDAPSAKQALGLLYDAGYRKVTP